MQVRSSNGDIGQLRRVQQPRVVRRLLGAHIEGFLIRPLRPAVAIRAAIRLRNRIAELVLLAHKQRAASLLRRRQFSARCPPAIRSRRQTPHVHHQVRQCQIVVVLRAPEVLLRPRPALRRQVWIAAIPLERLRILHSLDRSVIDDIAAKPVRFQVPRQSIKGRIDVAVCAPDLSLK